MNASVNLSSARKRFELNDLTTRTHSFFFFDWYF